MTKTIYNEINKDLEISFCDDSEKVFTLTDSDYGDDVRFSIKDAKKIINFINRYVKRNKA